MGINPSKPNTNDTKKDLDQFQNQSEDSGKKVVMEKLQALYGEKLQGESLDKFASILSDKERLKEIYLHTDFEKAKELQRSIKDLKMITPTVLQRATMKYSSQASASPIGGSEMLEAAKSSRRSSSAVENSSSSQLQQPHDEEEYEDDETTDVTDTPMQNPYTELDNNKIRIKLIVAETSKNALEKNLKRMISPFVDMEKRKAPFGFFHIALAVGCWKIEWNNSSLCIPRTVTGNYALICADIESIASLDELEFVRDKLAETIVKWNTSVFYKQQKGDPDNGSGNCQQFIDEILQNLGLSDYSSSFPLPLANYLKTLREEGYGEMVFELEDSFKQKFFSEDNPETSKYLKKKSIHFKSHKELDLFAKALFDIDPDFQINHKYEYYLLKAYDRGFWMRHLKPAGETNTDKENYEPLEEEDGTLACKFGDPTLHSFLAFNLAKKR
ncbi:hypothetical protein FDP41_003880 [Naegleria fowleri]|uniref:Uncharacterized protein n=1 Tax=Naegleria fowleri TaxID=5763 RepID=A0A6A5BJP4_NAEFO|nr:uncharacterized protein FDP41_003880 [Naegleria fowleri]KAF0977227.1 hypothetical protein FDP41_003880 [Naegleria fowleri]